MQLLVMNGRPRDGVVRREPGVSCRVSTRPNGTWVENRRSPAVLPKCRTTAELRVCRLLPGMDPVGNNEPVQQSVESMMGSFEVLRCVSEFLLFPDSSDCQRRGDHHENGDETVDHNVHQVEPPERFIRFWINRLPLHFEPKRTLTSSPIQGNPEARLHRRLRVAHRARPPPQRRYSGGTNAPNRTPAKRSTFRVSSKTK